MAIVKPFKAIRPAKEYASQIAALPYDVYNREESVGVVPVFRKLAPYSLGANFISSLSNAFK